MLEDATVAEDRAVLDDDAGPEEHALAEPHALAQDEADGLRGRPQERAHRATASARSAARSASTISAIIASKPIRGSQPSTRRAREGSPTGGVALGRADERGVHADVGRDVDAGVGERHLDEVADGPPHTARDHVVARLVVAQREPRSADDVGRVRPVADGAQVADDELVAAPERDRRRRPRHLARQKALGPARRLVVVRDARSRRTSRSARAAPRPGRGPRAWPRRRASAGASASARAAATRRRRRRPRSRSRDPDAQVRVERMRRPPGARRSPPAIACTVSVGSSHECGHERRRGQVVELVGPDGLEGAPQRAAFEQVAGHLQRRRRRRARRATIPMTS